ncbi:MAG: NUDIX hydrolase [Chloroflexi bacterium]|nr:NUDIX hydrolase [Chloroflexota bacterium]
MIDETDLYPRHIVAVAGLVKNDRGYVLMIRSPKRGWEFPGGQVEEGENLIQALQREIREETGVTAIIGSLAVISSNVKPPTKLMLDFVGHWESGVLRPSYESLEVAWVKPDEVLPRISHPAIYDRMRTLMNYSGEVVYRVYKTKPYHVFAEHMITGVQAIE